MPEYSVRFHKGIPAKSEVVHEVFFEAANDLSCDKLRKEYEKTVEFEYDFNLMSIKSYLEPIYKLE